MAFNLLFSVIGSFGWFWMVNLHKNIQLMLEFLKKSRTILGPTFCYYILMGFLMMLSIILLFVRMILLSTLNVIWFVATTRSDFGTWIWSARHCGLEQKVACWFQCWKNATSFVWLVWKHWWYWCEYWSFNMLGMTFSSKLDWDSYIISIAKTVSKKIGALIRSMKFLSLEVVLYLYKSAIRPCMENCCHVWAGPPCYYLELLDKPQERICMIVGPSLAASLEPSSHRRNLASLSLFYMYYFSSSTELSELVPLPYSQGRSTHYSDRLHDFSVTIPRCYKDIYCNSFFSRTTRLWNSLIIECFSLTSELSGFKSRISRHLLTVGSF